MERASALTMRRENMKQSPNEEERRMDKQELYNRYSGAMVGFMIGDAMGAAVEFMNELTIKIRYGEIKDILGGGWLGLKPGDVTDDTQMTECVIETIYDMYNSKGVYDFKRGCADHFVKWLDLDPIDVGGACRAGIRYYANTGKYIPNNDSIQGNGSLMRALPCWMIGSLMLNLAQSDITHPSMECRNAIVEYHEVMDGIMMGKDMSKATDTIMEPTGHVRNTLNNAIYWATTARTFEEAMSKAVSHGGDADTIGAVTGSIAGLRFGFGAIPYRWVDVLNRKVYKRLVRFVDRIYDGACDRWCQEHAS